MRYFATSLPARLFYSLPMSDKYDVPGSSTMKDWCLNLKHQQKWQMSNKIKWLFRNRFQKIKPRASDHLYIYIVCTNVDIFCLILSRKCILRQPKNSSISTTILRLLSTHKFILNKNLQFNNFFSQWLHTDQLDHQLSVTGIRLFHNK